MIRLLLFLIFTLPLPAPLFGDEILVDDFSLQPAFEADWFRYGFLAEGITAKNRNGTPAGGAKARPEWWKIEDGALVGTRFPEEGHPAGTKRTFPEEVDSDIRVSFRFRFPENGKIGFGIQGDNPVVEKQFHIAGLAMTPSKVIAWDNDVKFPKDSPEAAEIKAAGGWNRKFFYAKVEQVKTTPDEWHNVVATLRGRELTVTIDGKEVMHYLTLTGDVAKMSLTFSADSIAPPSGVRDAAVRAEFDDLRVENITGG